MVAAHPTAASASLSERIADRATTRLIRERFYFAASIFAMLAVVLFLTVVLMAAR